MSNARRVIGWDTETALIMPAIRAPRLACLQWCDTPTNDHPSEWPAHLHDATEARRVFREWLADPSIILVGANVAYDVCVMMQDDPSCVGAVFDAYEADRIADIQIRQKLLDIAAGRYRGEFGKSGKFIKYKYSLEDVTRRLLGWQLSKPKFVKDEITGEMVNTTPDHWRLRYGELIGTPIEQWPAGAVAYALDDGRATLGDWYAQEEHAEYLADQHRQCRRFLALSLMEAWGLRTHAPGVAAFEKHIEERLAELRATLSNVSVPGPSPTQRVPVLKKDGTRNMFALGRLMYDACTEKGLSIIPTDTAEAVLEKGGEWDYVAKGYKGVALDADSCKRVEDPRLDAYAEFVTLGYQKSKDLKLLKAGVEYPVHTRFDMAETGRTTSSNPNVQNFGRKKGVRECCVPRVGWVYAQADLPGGELKTLAQVCIWLFGDSTLGVAINSGTDPHLMLAANIAHVSYDEAKALYKADKNWKPRQAAKVANFGFPGGLGYASFVEYARASYGVNVTEEEAKELKRYWFATWPEMRHYFNYVSDLCENGDATIVHPGSERVRGGVRYTAACNGFFQGLLADATSTMLWNIAKACYAQPASPMFGVRPVNFVHDEEIAEVKLTHVEDRVCGACGGSKVAKDSKPCKPCRGSGVVHVDVKASAAVKEMTRIMTDSCNLWLPDVPFKQEDVEPCLMTHWSKEALTMFDTNGDVAIWGIE